MTPVDTLPSMSLLGTRLTLTDYDALSKWCLARKDLDGAVALEFANVHVVTLRRHDPAYRELTSCFDLFLPDGMPLVWCLNRSGAGLSDRVYGPTFMRLFLARSAGAATHYLLGGSPECSRALVQNLHSISKDVRIVGASHGDVGPQQLSRVLDEVRALEPDFVWVGLGTPRQQAFIAEAKRRLHRGVLLSVGFAFDVIAGTKRDAPEWMQERGLTWLFRLGSEPRRLAGRYLRYNSLFLYYLAKDGLPLSVDG